MRSTLALLVVLSCASAPTWAADRAWKLGTWGQPTDQRVYVIETARDVITGQASGSASQPRIDLEPGARVQFAIEGQMLYVLGSDKVEHGLRLLEAVPKYSNTYSALGGGHYIKSVAPGGTSVTLEDGSRWDMDPGQYFAIAGWQPDDLISVRRSTDSPDFAFEVDNTSQDDGAMANRRAGSH